MTCDVLLDPDINFMDAVKNVNCKYITESQFVNFFQGSKQNGIDILHANCRSLNKNFKSLLNLLHIASKNLTAIAVTETWLIPENLDLFNIDGYTFVANSRTDRSGGGVGIFINNVFEYRVLPDL